MIRSWWPERPKGGPYERAGEVGQAADVSRTPRATPQNRGHLQAAARPAADAPWNLAADPFARTTLWQTRGRQGRRCACRPRSFPASAALQAVLGSTLRSAFGARSVLADAGRQPCHPLSVGVHL